MSEGTRAIYQIGDDLKAVVADRVAALVSPTEMDRIISKMLQRPAHEFGGSRNHHYSLIEKVALDLIEGAAKAAFDEVSNEYSESLKGAMRSALEQRMAGVADGLAEQMLSQDWTVRFQIERSAAKGGSS